MTKIVPVIMSGGSGTRLWPLSTKDAPKQMHQVFGEATMLQQTAQRVQGDGFADPVVVCNAQHAQAVRAQFENDGMPLAQVIAEPCARNTAPCAAIAALAVRDMHGEDAQVLLLAADHFVREPEKFRQYVLHGAEVAEQGKILTFGAKPTRPETGYGYVLGGRELTDHVVNLERFVEKPDQQTAEIYLKDGGYFWNAGLFLYPSHTLLEELDRLRPEIAAQSQAAWDKAIESDGILLLDEAEFAQCPSEPVDTAVMEGTNKGAMVPFDVGWSDVGSWTTIHELEPKDEHGNHARGPVVHVDCKDTLLMSNGIQLAVAGMSNVAVIAEGNNVLVLPLDEAQKVKDLVAKLPDHAK